MHPAEIRTHTYNKTIWAEHNKKKVAQRKGRFGQTALFYAAAFNYVKDNDARTALQEAYRNPSLLVADLLESR